MSKKYNKGFVLGKFMPPHKGHIYFIEEALKQTEELYILVCSLKAQPIAGELRYEWMKELFPKSKVVHVTDENPSYPHEHPDFWSFWVRTVRNNTPSDIEVVFTSENYGEEMAAQLGIKHVLVDKERKVVPVSATMVRNDPQRYLDFLPENVRKNFEL
ncbi:MAG TPA: adenylyltransferase/cytidyltransferase family protein [Cytophagaceae bacterium]|jgi:HTH-type transcriptional repressor of NAD biosynthesis genes|nr:adenylyltransferase/cytidyltransferase family protein [Cytophagaceae bacterium]